MNPRLRPWILVLAALATLGIAAPSCADSARIDEVEKDINRVSTIATRVNSQIVTLQTTTKTADQEIAEIRAAINEVNTALEALRNEVSGEGSLTKRVDDLNKKVSDLTSKLNALDQRIWVLESRYNDHLRKYHGG